MLRCPTCASLCCEGALTPAGVSGCLCPAGGGLRARICRPPTQGLMWDGRAPSQHGGRATLTPLSSSSTLPGRRCPHSIFFLVCPSCWCWRVRQGPAFPGAPAQALTGGHEDRIRSTPGPLAPTGQNNYTWQLVCVYASPERGQGQVQVSPRPPGGAAAWSGARPYYSRSSVEMLLDGQTTRV